MIEKSRISDYTKVKILNQKMKGEVVMKRMYEKPMAYEEVFKANEYIAACITGVIQDIYIEIADYEKNMPFTDGLLH